ncbi:uncharacterized protein [Rutidosis leptorrhynchoides]|uniref:uncharacterized protein n=1 Tax=Rutidosis leptorrhynchoides TaxID=125765 RepID=UPI003A99A02A
MDSTWISLCGSSPAYKKGLDKFIERIFSKKGKDGHIYCPCKYCGNHKRVDWVHGKTHLLCDGFFEGYKIPNVYFEPDDTPTFEDADEDDMQALAQCIFNVFEDEDEDEDEDDIQQTENQTVPNLNDENFNKVLEDSKKELYPCCKFSVLSFIIRLFHSKCVGKCNEKGFSMILDTMREAFSHAAIPKSLYELRKIIRDLGLGYEKIDACPNDYSPAWKTFDYENSEFAKEPRNVRLGLASDGFNPFGNMSVSHSNNIDVYMQPLVDELKELWDTGVNIYDTSTKSYFTVCASLLWTVSDFPAYANLSGWSIKGKLACPSCHKETRSTQLSNSYKEIFMAHRRWLELLHPFCMDKDSFDGTKECEGTPHSLTGEQVLAELKGFEIKFGKLVKDNPSLPYIWKKRNGKTKDHLKGRRDLEEMGIRHELHPEPLSNDKVYLPPACFEMDKKEKENFVKPTPKMLGLKSHDNHILMQQLLPVAIRNILPKYLGTLKSYVRNKSKPEGSIVEGYLAEECLSFCFLYLASDVKTIHNKTSRNYDDGGDDNVLPIFCMPGRPIDATSVVKLSYDTLAIAHSHVLFNCSEIDFLRTEHLNILSHQNPKKCKRDIQHLHSQEFEEWLSDYVDEDMTSRDNRITSDIETLENGPSEVVKKHKGYVINGFRFHIKDVEKNRTTQNSGVILQALTSSFSSARDNDPIVGDVTYYDVLKDIIELQIKVDENGFTTLDFRGLKQTKEPYVLASQAQQVFYVADPVCNDWKVVIKTTPRDNFDMDEQICIDDVETHL